MPKRQTVRKSLKEEVFKQKGIYCWIQRPGCTVRATTVDHVIPKALGGEDHIDNLRPACGRCNSVLGGELGAHLKKMKQERYR